jgi:hypothetical protein
MINSSQEDHMMRTVPDTDLQARLLKEILDAHVRKQKLEEEIRTADALSKLLIDSGALRDIEAYKNRPLVRKLPQ